MQYDQEDEGPPSGGESDTGSEGKKPGRRGRPGRKPGRVSGRGSAAGPPVDGALARVDVWLPDCDIHGNPHGKVGRRNLCTRYRTGRFCVALVHYPKQLLIFLCTRQPMSFSCLLKAMLMIASRVSFIERKLKRQLW